MDADQLLGILWRKRVTAFVTFVCAFAAVALVTYSLPRTYSTNAYVIVNPINPSSNDYAAQQVSQVDTQTTSELLQTRNTADLVARALPYKATPKRLKGRVDISPVAQTQLVLITANESTPWRAQQLANTYASVFTTQVAPTIGFARPSVAQTAPLVATPSAPRVPLYLLVGAILAAMTACGAALVRERLDRSLRIDEFDAELLGLPILARVPEVATVRRKAGDGAPPGDHDIRFLEGFRWVFANLAFVRGGERPATIAVVSAGEAEGKSTVCVAMAHAAEEVLTDGVLLVDGDLRRPSLERRLGLPEKAEEGLSSYLAEPALRHDLSALTQKMSDANIALIPAGPEPPSPASLLGMPTLGEFVGDVSHLYGMVVFDTPPISAGADASLIAQRTEGAILVVDARSSRVGSVEWSLEQLQRARVNVVGVIVNRVSASSASVYAYGRDRGGRRSQRERRRAAARVPAQ